MSTESIVSDLAQSVRLAQIHSRVEELLPLFRFTLIANFRDNDSVAVPLGLFAYLVSDLILAIEHNGKDSKEQIHAAFISAVNQILTNER